jgi:alkylation response protein AidB-like acyl-CoA dehydrogenase
MDFSYSEEQQMLQDSVSKFINKDYDFDSRWKITDSPKGYSEVHWKLFAELGWLMVPFSEEQGGFGGSAVDLIVVMEEFGKGMVVEPFIATAVMAGGLIAEAGSDKQKKSLLEPLMDGKLQLAFAFTEPQSRFNLTDVKCHAQRQGNEWLLSGHKSVVLNGPSADKVIVAARTSGAQRDSTGISLFIIDTKQNGIINKSYETVDGHRAADLWFDKVVVADAELLGELDNALPVIQKVIDKATLAICAEAVGAMEVSYKKTVEYTKIRKQFGREISTFQALQHRMAKMFIEHEQAKSILLMAALNLDDQGGYNPKVVSAAKSRIGKAARLIGQEAVQIHGGIGCTDELDIGHFFKRLTTVQYLFGSTDYHTQRFSAL